MKHSSGKPGKKNRNLLPASGAPNLRLLSEQMMADIHRVMDGREFASIEDANAFLAMLTGNVYAPEQK